MSTFLKSHCPACLSTQVSNRISSETKDFSLEGFVYAVCGRCRTVYLETPIDKDKLVSIYNTGALSTTAWQDDTRQRDIRAKYLSPERAESIKKIYITPLTEHIQSGSALEIGCGVGWFSYYLKQAGFETKAFDVQNDVIDLAKRVFEINAEVGNEEVLDQFADQQIDVISALASFEHLLEPETFLQKAGKALREQGLLYLVIPTVDSLQYKYLEKDFYWLMAPYHINLFSMDGLECLMDRNGFTMLENRPIKDTYYWTKAVADSLGIADSYRDWRGSKEFVQFDTKIDTLLDQIAFDLNQSVARLIICQLSGNKTHQATDQFSELTVSGLG
jgi:SAM-dependent methyltransferase